MKITKAQLQAVRKRIEEIRKDGVMCLSPEAWRDIQEMMIKREAKGSRALAELLRVIHAKRKFYTLKEVLGPINGK